MFSGRIHESGRFVVIIGGVDDVDNRHLRRSFRVAGWVSPVGIRAGEMRPGVDRAWAFTRRSRRGRLLCTVRPELSTVIHRQIVDNRSPCVDRVDPAGCRRARLGPSSDTGPVCGCGVDHGKSAQTRENSVKWDGLIHSLFHRGWTTPPVFAGRERRWVVVRGVHSGVDHGVDAGGQLWRSVDNSAG